MKDRPTWWLYANFPQLAALISTLPEKWTATQRGKFIETFTAVLDYVIPVDGEKP